LRDVLKLLHERMHQPLKLSICSGNGHDDVNRAMTKMVDNEIVSRLAMYPSKFDVLSFWLRQASLRMLFQSAVPLASLPVESAWTAGRHCAKKTTIRLVPSGYWKGA